MDWIVKRTPCYPAQWKVGPKGQFFFWDNATDNYFCCFGAAIQECNRRRRSE